MAPRLPSELARLIYKKHDEGKSQRCIAAELLISKKAVHGVLNRRDGATLRQVEVPLGRRRCTSTRTDRAILLAVKRDRFSTNAAIASNFNVSRDTIRRRALQFKLRSRVAHRDYLKKCHKTARRRWCIGHVKTNFQFWILSDEASFELRDCSAPQRLRVHRHHNEKFAPCCILPAPVSCRRKLMVWGFITSSGPGTLTFVDGSITADKYVDILRHNLVPFLEDQPLSYWTRWVFQHDNAAPHSANVTRKFLLEQKISVTSWPSLSPDLNPIENVWALMKREVRKKNLSSLEALRREIIVAWNNIVTPSLCQRLFASMPRRLMKVICNRGLR